MKKYEIIGRVIELHEGVVEVTASQAKRRSAMLAPIGGDLYRIDNPVQFKVGEVIGIDYEPPKSLADFMRLVEEVPEAAPVDELPEFEKVEEVQPIKTFKHKGRK